MLRKKSLFPLLAAAAVLSASPSLHAQAPLNLVPWPQKIDQGAGALELSGSTRIATEDATLLPLAKVLSEEFAASTGGKFEAVAEKPNAGDISLLIDSSLKGEAHTVTVDDKGAVVRGGNYQAVALGTTTLLQAVQKDGEKLSLPAMKIEDHPTANFRGLLLDVARQPHSIANIKQIVNLCRLYKTRYLQLHLTDDQLWMFPSKAYPLLGTNNLGGVKPYTIEELKDLVAYADARGVTIIPEFDVPGHSGTAVRTMPELFTITGTKPYIHHASINFAKEEVMKAVETIIAEMCEIFKSTPYFHIGGDEADLSLAGQNPEFQAALKKHDLPSIHEFYRYFLVQMNEVIKKQGKQMIVWEGFHRGGKVEIPRDVIVMAYEMQFYMPDHLVEDGYEVINASWTPLYVVNKKVRPASEIYAWNMFQFKRHGAPPEDQGIVLPKTDKVIGAHMCSWEQPEEIEVSSLRGRLPAMAERIWNADAGKDFADFEKRFTETDKILEKLIQ
jgi:hexosaminidase